MENNKKTALKWFEEQLYEFETITDSLPNKIYDLLSIAKDMEKENIIEAHKDGFLSAEKNEDYFNKKYN